MRVHWARIVGLSALTVLGSVWQAPAQDLRSSVEQLGGQITKAVPPGRQLRIAVADFPDLQGVTSDLGRYVASRLTTRLAQNPSFFVIERQRLSQVLTELKFSMSDLVDPSKAKQLGRMVGVEAIIVGTVADIGNQVDIDARLIEIETNRTVLGATVTLGKDPAVTEMLQRGRTEPTQASVGGSAATGTVSPPSSSPGPAIVAVRGLAFNDRRFSFEVRNVEIVADEVRVILTYLNRTDVVHLGQLFYRGDSVYLVDNFGNRYSYTGDSFNRHRQFAPQVPERIWISFGKVQPGASAANLAFKWNSGANVWHDVLIRGIPLRR